MKAFVAGLLLAFATVASANDACTNIHPGGQGPVLTNQKLAPKTRYLCFDDFAVLHSGVTHTPLWSAEHLTRESLASAKGLTRTNRFYEEPSLPPGEGATLADYRHVQGVDRGHMSPAGDRSTEQSMAESFTLSNIVPQSSNLNRHLWSRIESSVRYLTKKSGEAYVVTGPLFIGKQLQTIGTNKVFVPTQIFKVVYLPSQQLAFAIVVDNVDTDSYSVKTVHELEAMSGISFPGIPESAKSKTIGGLKGV